MILVVVSGRESRLVWSCSTGKAECIHRQCQTSFQSILTAWLQTSELLTTCHRSQGTHRLLTGNSTRIQQGSTVSHAIPILAVLGSQPATYGDPTAGQVLCRLWSISVFTSAGVRSYYQKICEEFAVQTMTVQLNNGCHQAILTTSSSIGTPLKPRPSIIQQRPCNI